MGSGTGPGAARDAEADRATLRAVQASAQGGDMARASTMAEQALQGGLEHPLLFNLVALGLEQAGRLDEAAALLRRGLAIAPQDAGTRNALGLVLMRLEQPEEALGHFETVLKAHPQFAPVHASCGGCLESLGRMELAEACYRRALELEPGNLAALAGMASVHGRRGQHAEARDFAAQVLAREPNYPQATMDMAAADLALGDPASAEARVRALLADPRPSLAERSLATSLLGDVLDAQDRPAEAFEAYLASGRELQRLYGERYGTGPGVLDLARRLNAELQAAAPLPEAAPPRSGDAGGARAHVFLVGFPRSGTTLLEQILAGHPDVQALEERETLADSAGPFLTRAGGIGRLSAAGQTDLNGYRQAYWRRVRAEGAVPDGKVFVDKYPLNTLKLPLIRRLFPEAKVLFALRDPRDVVLSCFRRRFRMNASMFQFLTPEGTAALYDATMALAARLEPVLGAQLLRVRHETLVADFDGEVGRVCDFLGLEWTADMRDFAARTRDRGIATPSAAQLARGLSAEGVGQWRRYREPLAPVLPVLKPWVERFGYDPD